MLNKKLPMCKEPAKTDITQKPPAVGSDHYGWWAFHEQKKIAKNSTYKLLAMMVVRVAFNSLSSCIAWALDE